MGKSPFVPIVLGLVLGFGASVAGAASVVTNGSFDDNSSGWVGSYDIEDGEGFFNSYPQISSGSYYTAGAVQSNEISQTYQLTATDIIALSTQGMSYNMSADLFGYSISDDYAYYRVDFLDANGSLLRSVLLSAQAIVEQAFFSWDDSLVAGGMPHFQSAVGSVHPLTRSIVFTVGSERKLQVGNNDGYVDNVLFEFEPIPPATVPVPTGLPLLAGSVGLLVLRARWSHRKRAALG